MTSLPLLEAIDRGAAQTPADIATALGIDEADAARQLKHAEDDGWIAVEETATRHVQSGVQGRWLRLTDAGRAELNRLRGS